MTTWQWILPLSPDAQSTFVHFGAYEGTLPKADIHCCHTICAPAGNIEWLEWQYQMDTGNWNLSSASFLLSYNFTMEGNIEWLEWQYQMDNLNNLFTTIAANLDGWLTLKLSEGCPTCSSNFFFNWGTVIRLSTFNCKVPTKSEN